MPRIHDPAAAVGGPRSALAASSRRRRLKKKNKSSSDKTTGTLIGEDLLEWKCEEEEPPKKKASKIVLKDHSSRGRGKAGDAPTKQQAQQAAQKKRASHAPASPISVDSPATAKASLTNTAATVAPPPALIKHVRHALLLDTRTINTEQGRAASRNVLDQIRSFLEALDRRGASPCLLASSYIRNHRSSVAATSRGTIQVQAEHYMTLDATLGRLEAVPVRPPLNAGNTKNVEAVHIPKRLLAHDSWKLFGELVEAVIQQDRHRPATESFSTVPLDITILTNDIAFLCDTKETSHKCGLNRFWERIKPSFRSDLIRSIAIVVAETGIVELVHSPRASKGEDDDDDDERSSSTDASASSHHASLQRQATIVKCLASIRSLIEQRVESDYKNNTASYDLSSPVTLHLSSIDNTGVGYKTILRKWIRDIMSPPNGCSGRISFDLPETVDGMQCSLSLDVNYKIMPYRVDSTAAAGMLADLQLLSESSLEVIQLVPLACVDSKLMFGVPMEVRAAAERDLLQYKEMKILLSFLFGYLYEKELGLVLRSTGGGRNTTSTEFGPPLNHTDGQLMLLVAEELPGRKQDPSALQSSSGLRPGKPVPCAGVLFRYTSAEQLLDAGSSEVYAIDGETDDEWKQFAECVESSLDFVDNNVINPLMIEELFPRECRDPAATQIKDDSLSDSDEDVWAEECGVGTRVCAEDDIVADGNDDDDGHTMENQSLHSFSYDE